MAKLNFDLRPVDTRHTLSAIRKYLQIMEEQMPTIESKELSDLEAERPTSGCEEEYSIFSSIVSHTENLFEEDIIPTMRYSFVVFLHTVFETRLRSLCDDVKQEKGIPISVSELRGSAIDQARDYLSKLADIQVGSYGEWNSLRDFQKIRDCIVHSYGFVSSGERGGKAVERIIEGSSELTLNHRRRICPTRGFCLRQLEAVEAFLNRLMADMGWEIK